MIFEFLNALPLSLLWLLLFVLIAGAAAFGVWLGLRRSASEPDKDAGNMATAALGLLALLIAFTYSMSLARYDLRRQTVLEEANAIGSTANFALMLPPADQGQILGRLREFTQVRLDLGVPYDESKLDRDIATSNGIAGTLWKNAVAIEAAQPQGTPQPSPVYRYIASLNEMNNIAEKRVTALRNHVPVVILLMLFATAMVAMGFTGYGAGVSGRKRAFTLTLMSGLIAFLIVVTQDLARPDRGAIEVSSQALRDTLQAIPKPDK